MKKTVTIAASLLLVGFGASACGSGAGGAPKDASLEDFCATLSGIDENSKFADLVGKMKDTGTPSDMPDDARKGFEYLVENAKKFDDADRNMDEAAQEKEFGADVIKEIQAFGLYYGQKCIMANMPTDMPSMPTEMPSGFPSDMPTDFPTQ